MLRFLLRLYPEAFRKSLGQEALRQLESDLAAARAHGGSLSLLTRWRPLADFVAQGLLARGDQIVSGAAGIWIGWTQDLRLALRSTVRRPTFAVVSIASVAIGVGANAVMFSIADTLFLRAIPGVSDPERIVEIGMTQTGRSGFERWSFPDFEDLRAEAPLTAAALYDTGPVSLSDDEHGEQLLALFTTQGFFEVMGVDLDMGRTFARSEEGGAGDNPVAILSYRTWVDRFSADPGALGRTIRLNRGTYTVIGVVPERFRGPQFGVEPAVYLPISQRTALRADPERFYTSRNTSWAQVLARLAPGTELDELNAALTTIFARIADEHPESNRDRSVRAAQAGMAPAEARAQMALVFLIISSLALLVLAATCANVAGMLLARASAREREIAVRAALGSGRARLVRHLMTEALVVFGLGGAVGIWLATRILRLDPNAFLPVSIPVQIDFVLDWRLGAFGLVLTGLTGLTFGLLPALRVTRRDLAGTLRDAGGGAGLRASRLRRVFVAGQVAISVLLLVTAGLFVRSMFVLSDVNPGLDTHGIYVTSLDLALEGYDEPEQALSFVDRLLEAVRAMPDAAGATVATDIPADGGSSGTPVWPDGRAGDDAPWVQAHYGRVSDGYFDALGIDVVRGRSFEGQDGAYTERVAVVNETFAKAAWPETEAVGRTIEFGLEPQLYTVVGVVADTKTDMVTDRQSAQVFSYLPQDYDGDLHLAVRQSGASDDFVPRMRRTILSVDPALAISLTRSLDDLAGLGLLPTRIMAGVGTTLGFLALLLSALGLYGVVAFAVTQQTREIGVRIALGAERSNVIGRVLLGGMTLALPGIAFGLALAIGMGRIVGGILPFSPLNLPTYGIVAILLVGVIVGACLAPAWRAASVQPLEALRYE